MMDHTYNAKMYIIDVRLPQRKEKKTMLWRRWRLVYFSLGEQYVYRRMQQEEEGDMEEIVVEAGV